MKRYFAITLLAIFAAVALPVASSDQAEAATQTQKPKAKKKPVAKKPAAKPAASVGATAGATAAGAAAATGAAATAATPTAASPAATAATPAAPAPEAAKPAEPAAADVVKTDLYTVAEGFRVDEKTMNGFRAWRAAACDRCHGPNQEGMVGPALIDSLKRLTKDEFKTTVANGRLEKGMPSFSTSEQVMKNLDNLYAYLKGRSDGNIKKAKVIPLD
jgi:hypothetical protein